MDKLERYLDQVCRSIGGPKALRQHVRQELREHLLDAMAQHKAAGLPEEEALDRALEEFGNPEDVRSELEATHGHRMMAVVIDKALQWKEKTMRARWLWATWAVVVLVMLIAMEVLFILFNVAYIIPKFQKLRRDGIIDPGAMQDSGVGWLSAFVDGLNRFMGNFPAWYLLIPAAVWGLFEWRVKSENKMLMRLGGLGTVAVALLVVVALTSGSLVIEFCVGVPAVGRLARPFAEQQVTKLDSTTKELEQALARKDWPAMQQSADEAAKTLKLLAWSPVLPSLTRWNEKPTLEEMQIDVNDASDALVEAQQAIKDKDAARVETALQKYRKAYEPVREAAKRAVR
jgi:hypothetical protein